MRPSHILLSAALVGLAGSLQAQTLGCETGGTGGIIPTSGTGGSGVYPTTLPPFETVTTLNVVTIPPGSTALTEVKLNGLTHTFIGDISFVLTDPSGTRHMIYNRQGGGCDVNGDYVILPGTPVPGGNTPIPACSGTPSTVPPSSFSQHFGTWPTGTNSINNTLMGSIAPAVGVWTLTMYDWAAGDVGALTSFDLCFGNVPPPPPPPPPAGPACTGTDLTTLFLGGNSGSAGGQVFFDMTVTNPITLSQIDINSNTVAGVNYVLAMYVCPTTYIGNTNLPGNWTFLSWGNGVTVTPGTASVTEMEDAALAPGSYGVTLVLSSSAAFRYTNGNGTNQMYSNADLSLSLGAALNVPWTGTAFTPRVWNGTIRYNCGTGGGPTIYCTAKTTSSGCVPAIAFAGTPSAAGAYTVSCSQVEAGQLGVLFYGTTGPAATPFQGGFLCANPPVIRMPVQSSGGAAACSGTYTQDMTSVITSLNIGDMVNCQYWFRDPGAATGTGLSDANEFVVE